MNPDRPSPEDFLEVLRKEEWQKTRGRLKIFLGLAAGVGKTYAMLREAHRILKEGVDVVIGVIDTHGRVETAALLMNLKIVPLMKQLYKTKEFEELDVDAILTLHPQVVLIDELAHNNIPGSKHTKRWQDVLEILDNGIDVYTTLNVQHIESLNDIIRGITEIAVRETVPDHVIDQAASIQLVDLTPDELLQRLEEGKVYFDEQSKTASLHFFQREKLTALREVALRYAADKVDHDLRDMATPGEKIIDWKPREKFLTAISSSPHSQKLIRTTRRVATAIGAPWVALHVDDGTLLNDADNEQLAKNFALARDLGAEVVAITDSSITNGIKRTVKQKGITQIIVGRAPKTFFFNIFRSNSLLEKITTECRSADIHIIREEKNQVQFHKKFFSSYQLRKWNEYPYVLLLTTLIAFAGFFALPYIGVPFIGVMFLVAIVFFGLFFKKGPVIVSSMIFALLWNFLFMNNSKEEFGMMAISILVALTLGILLGREKEYKASLEKSEESIRALYAMTHQIATAPSIDAILKFIQEHFNRILHGSFQFSIKAPEGGLDLSKQPLTATDKEKTAALWSFNNGKEAGWSTDTLPSAENLYIPLKGYHEVIGLLIYRPNKNRVLSTEEKNFIHTVCGQLSHYLERSFIKEKSHQHDKLMQVQKIHKMILDRFHHAFQWPIENLKVSLEELKAHLSLLKVKPKFPELNVMETSIEAITKNLTNIATMTELSEGMIPLKKALHSVGELIEDSALYATPLLTNHKLKISVKENLPLISFDYYLIQILVNNLILNAIEYSEPGTEIQIEAKKANDFIHISIADEGKGIPEAHLNSIFDKFYRLPNEPLPRVGLGLAIAKTIAELHQGSLKAENNPGKGSCFSFFLPIKPLN